jgi:hypothetical protein
MHDSLAGSRQQTVCGVRVVAARGNVVRAGRGLWAAGRDALTPEVAGFSMGSRDQANIDQASIKCEIAIQSAAFSL